MPRTKNHVQPSRVTQVFRCVFPLRDEDTSKEWFCGKRLAYGGFRAHVYGHLEGTAKVWNSSMYDVYGKVLEPSKEDRLTRLERILMAVAEKVGVNLEDIDSVAAPEPDAIAVDDNAPLASPTRPSIERSVPPASATQPAVQESAPPAKESTEASTPPTRESEPPVEQLVEGSTPSASKTPTKKATAKKKAAAKKKTLAKKKTPAKKGAAKKGTAKKGTAKKVTAKRGRAKDKK